MLQFSIGQLNPICDTHVIHFDYTQSSFSMDEKETSLRNAKLKANRATETDNKTTKERKAEDKMQK